MNTDYMSTIFNRWYKFSHLKGSFNQPAIPSETTSWTYDAITDSILCQVNSTSYIGFVSINKYEKYNHTVTLKSSDSDDDLIGVVVAFEKDHYGREHTLSAVRSCNGMPNKWQLIYNYHGQDEKILVDGNTKLTKTATGWSTIPKGTVVKIERNGSAIVAYTSQLNETTLDLNTRLEINLNDFSELEIFKGKKSYGYSCLSQAQSTFKDVVFENLDTSTKGVIFYNGNLISKTESDALFNLGYIDKTKKTFFENLDLILCKPDGTEISVLQDVYNIQLTLNLHDIDELEFDIPYYIYEQYNQIKNYNWKNTGDYLLVKVNNKQVFVINQVTESGDNINTKHIHAYSKEYLLSKRKLALLQGTRQLYRDGSEATVSKISYSLDNVLWTDYTTPFTTEDGKNIFIKIYDHFGHIIGNSNTWNNKDNFSQVDGIDISYVDTDIFNKKIQVVMRIVSETGDGILNILENETSWKIGHIDSNVREDRNTSQSHRKYRTFDINNQSWIEVLYTTISDLFECVVRVDTLNQVINIYDKNTFGENKGLFISKENYLKYIKRDLKNDEVVTRLRVYGKDNLTIASVNPTGKEYIEDFGYYRNNKYMPYGLLQALDDYDNLLESNALVFKSILQQLVILQDEKIKLENQLVDLEFQKLQKEDLKDIAIQNATHNVNYASEAGTETINGKIAIDFSDLNAVDLTTYNQAIYSIQTLIDAKKSEISNIETQINTAIGNIETLKTTLDKKNNFTIEQLKILDTFVKEEVWENNNYSDSTELMVAGIKKIQEINKPIVELDIGIIDFLNIVECQNDWSKLNIGDIINVYYDDFDLYEEARIIKIDHGVDENSLSITISNKSDENNDVKYLSDLMNSANSANSTINAFKHEWDLSGKNTDMISEIMSSGLNSAKNRITSARNQNVIIDERGISMKDLFSDDEQLRIVNNCLAMTTDGWDTVSLGITPHGVIAEQLYGKIVGTNKLIITNMNESGESSFLVDGSHMTATNMDLSLVKKSLLNRIYMNPDYGFKIQKRGAFTSPWEDLLWLGMDGEIYAQSFHVINTDSVLDDKGLSIDNGKIKIVNNNNYDAFYADENGEMRLDGRMRVIRHLSTWTPSGTWDNEPESNRVILLDAYKDDNKGGKLLVNDWEGNKTLFLGSAPDEAYKGGFIKIFNGTNEDSQERIELGVLATDDSGIIHIKNKDSKNIVELKGDGLNNGVVSIRNPINDNAIVSMSGNTLGGYIGLFGNDTGSINGIFGTVEDELYDLVGGYIELFSGTIDKLKVRIGAKRNEDAGTMELYGLDNKLNLYMSAIDNDNNSISSGVFKIFDSNNKPTLLMYAETPLNISGREGSVDSAFIIGQDKEHAKVGMYGGGNNTGALLELASGGINSLGSFPNLSLGDLSSNGSYLGGNIVIYENMASNTSEERSAKRRIQLGVFNDGSGGTRGEIRFFNKSGALVGTVTGGTVEDHIIVTGVFRGNSTFAGTGGRFISCNIGTTNYTPVITPTGNPNGYLGEVWVTKASNGFTVYNSGTATSSFDYTIIR